MRELLAVRFLFAGLGCFVLGGYLFFSYLSFLRQTVVVPGTVVRYKTHISSDKKEVTYIPMVAYSFEGKKYEVPVFRVSSRPNKMGQKRKVRINPEKPSNGRAEYIRDDLLYPIVYGVMGMICLLFCVAFWPNFSFFVKRSKDVG